MWCHLIFERIRTNKDFFNNLKFVFNQNSLTFDSFKIFERKISSEDLKKDFKMKF